MSVGAGGTRGVALYLALVVLVLISLLVLTALDLADGRARAARQWMLTTRMHALVASFEQTGSAADSMGVGALELVIDSGPEGWSRDRVWRLEDSVFVRQVDLALTGPRGAWSRRRIHRLAVWCPGSDSQPDPRPLCHVRDWPSGWP
ncbi:MAG: hypothetical protein AAB075_00290 [Gemmatimonadota bacterium]